MARKPNPVIVGIMACSTCSDTLEVREKSNGRKLLYTYCPNCKMDQRSGDEIQAYWRKNMSPPDTVLNTVVEKDVLTVIAPNEPVQAQTVQTVLVDDRDEWKPDKQTKLDGFIERIEPKDDDSISFGGLCLKGLLTGVLVVCGIKLGNGVLNG